MTAPLALWHSTESNRAVFQALLDDLAPEIPLVHRVRADLLEAAQPGGLTPAIRRAVALDILQLADEGAGVVLCTCSTLGPGAESAADLTEAPVLRVDRPMVERALDHGRRIVIAAALQSTLGPTRELALRAARARGIEPDLREVLIADAWPFYATGDRDAYADRIADALRQHAGEADAIILAQASMAPAVDRLGDLGIPVLASPRLGAEAAIAAWRQAGARAGRC
jgi:Asp/Glu/hydantoin racemase